MSEELELKLLKEIEELKRELVKLKGNESLEIPTYQYSKMSFDKLNHLFNIRQKREKDIFDSWFNNNISLDKKEEDFLTKLIEKEEFYIDSYNEEDLKMNFLSPILNLVNFKIYEKDIKTFYEASLTYKTDKFILSGTTDFLVSKGLHYCEKPFFFIQEFKKGKENSDPEPQLLAELISAVELNNFTSMKGAFIVGAIWNFVILEKIETGKYQYFVSKLFNSTNIEDLKAIYKNLLFIKIEIIKMVEKA